jgi:hypothetical protein
MQALYWWALTAAQAVVAAVGVRLMLVVLQQVDSITHVQLLRALKTGIKQLAQPA